MAGDGAGGPGRGEYGDVGESVRLVPRQQAWDRVEPVWEVAGCGPPPPTADSCWGHGRGSEESVPRWAVGPDQRRAGAEEQIKILWIHLDASSHPSPKPSVPCLPEGISRQQDD